MAEMTILKEAKIFKGNDYYIEVKIAKMAGKYGFGLKYQNGSSCFWAVIYPLPKYFFYDTEQSAISKVIEWLEQKTEDCLDECTIENNRCRYTQQMHDSIVEQLRPIQLDLFTMEGV